MTTKFRTPFTKPVRVVNDSTPPPKRTKDSFKDECDINKMIARAQRNGQVLNARPGVPQYGDFASLPESYLEAHELVQRAESAFRALPAEVRAECGNDPALFLAKAQDREWALKHGLLKEEAKSPPGAPPAPPVPPGGAGASNPPSAKKNSEATGAAIDGSGSGSVG